MVTQHLQEIHDQWLADVMSLEPNGSFDYLLQDLPKVAEIGEDPTVRFKLFMPGTGLRWYVLAGHETCGDWILHCYATGPDHEYDEFGDVLLSDLLRQVGPLGASVERDRYFTPVPVSQIVNGQKY
ncbi:MAG TPA: hypothetical protein VN736_04400 [Candidatus Limnocylindrales bacterium]|nr:hypothetical protein [Candidatus Limnocylindrales bacterium]